MAGNFGDQVRALNERNKRRQQAIFATSAAEVLRIASVPKAQGGRMPVDTSALRNSSRASTSGMPSGSSAPPELMFATMRVGDTVTVGWTVAYARRMEFGFFGPDKLGRVYSQPGNHFLTTAVQQWPQIVDKATEQAQAIR